MGLALEEGRGLDEMTILRGGRRQGVASKALRRTAAGARGGPPRGLEVDPDELVPGLGTRAEGGEDVKVKTQVKAGQSTRGIVE